MMKLILFAVLLVAVSSKPLVDNNLPHSRDFYAGYIRAITDNFEQLFEGNRQTRSIDEDDEKDVDDKTVSKLKEAAKAAIKTKGVETAKDIKKFDPNVAEADPSESLHVEAAKRSEATAEKKEDKDDVEDKDDDKDEKKTKITDEEDKKDEKPAVSDNKKDDTAKKSETDKSDDNEDTQDEQDDEDANEAEKEDSSEIEDEQTVDFVPKMESAAQRGYILEHANSDTPIFPGEVRNYQAGAGDLSFAPSTQGPYALPRGAPLYKTMAGGKGQVVGAKREGAAAPAADAAANTDPHHLERILVAPQCNCHHDCHCDVHHHNYDDCCNTCCNNHHLGHINHHVAGCGNMHVFDHGCDTHLHPHGCHHDCLPHDIHHEPYGLPAYYSHDSPCLTYPHGAHLGYGYGHGCGHGNGYGYHGHHVAHPVLLHPTHQETHHHNIHTLHDDHCGYPGHLYGHGPLPILPHYGHVCGGHHGANPYWG